MATTTRTTTRTPRKTAKRTPAKKAVASKTVKNTAPKDTLDKEALAAEYKQAVGVIYSVPELQTLFETAISEGWAPSRVIASVQGSDWYRNNGESARLAWAKESVGGADWQQTQNDARLAVQSAASKVGAVLAPDELTALTRRYLYEGWDDPSRTGYLMQALSGEISTVKDQRGTTSMMGEAGRLQDTLKQTAMANGLSYTDNWYESAARSVTAGLSTADDWNRDIREQAAGYWPVYADKIRQGMNVYDLASSYINTMAQEFEIDPTQIKLEDPYIRGALTNMDDKGNPAALSLWDFQKRLRKDPRWQNTSKAQNEITSTAGSLMQMFGLMGG